MGAFVYILECADGSFYVGSTRNLELRLAQHNSGRGSVYTSARLPARLAYHQECESIDVAFALEKRIQNWSRAKRLALIEGRLDDLPKLSKKRRRG